MGAMVRIKKYYKNSRYDGGIVRVYFIWCIFMYF